MIFSAVLTICCRVLQSKAEQFWYQAQSRCDEHWVVGGCTHLSLCKKERLSSWRWSWCWGSIGGSPWCETWCSWHLHWGTFDIHIVSSWSQQTWWQSWVRSVNSRGLSTRPWGGSVLFVVVPWLSWMTESPESNCKWGVQLWPLFCFAGLPLILNGCDGWMLLSILGSTMIQPHKNGKDSGQMTHFLSVSSGVNVPRVVWIHQTATELQPHLLFGGLEQENRRWITAALSCWP